MTTTQFRVPDISCDHCVRAITTEVSAVAHVAKVTVDIPSKLVTIDHQNVPAPLLVCANTYAGFYTVYAVAYPAVL